MTPISGADPIGLMQADLSGDEQLRLAALRRFGILDTPPEPQFDHLVQLAARVFDMPMSLVTFVDEDRQWFKARHGFPVSETPRSESFCSVAIAQDGVMVIPDATEHEQLRTYPNVLAEPHIRSYAGAPLITPEGQKLGTFCIIGTEPREFSDREQQLLASFAQMAMAELKVRQALHDLSHMAMNDTLTGLPNRVQLRHQLIEACRRADVSGEKVVVGLLDLDRFKLINDTFGHAAGDGLLRGVARRLNEATATGDVVARMSGDEFVLLLTDVRSVADVALVTKRLEDRFAPPFLIGGQEVFVHWSLGLSVYPDDAREPDALLGHADAAMYRVKRAGGGHRPPAAIAMGPIKATQPEEEPLVPQPAPDLHLLSQTLAACTVGVVITDARQPDFPIVYVNPAFEQLSGYQAKELLGRNCRFLQRGDHDQAGMSEMRQALALQRTTTVVLRNYDRVGTLFYNELTLSPIRDASGLLTHYVGFQKDVTDREQAWQEQAQLQQIFSSTLERVTDGVVSFDLDWNIRYINAAAAAMVARQQSEVCGQNLLMLFPPPHSLAHRPGPSAGRGNRPRPA